MGFQVLFLEEPEDTPLPESLAKAVQSPMDILEHLNELRKNLFRGLLFLIITTAAAFAFIQPLLDWITTPVGGLDTLQAIEVTEPLGTVMRVALLAGFSAALPYITFEIWLFAAPGLKRRSRIFGLFAIPVAFLFFVAGMAFAYYVMMPVALPFLMNFMGITTVPRPSSYIRFVTGLMFWIGAAFEFPLVIFALANMGLIQAKTLAAQWRIAILIIAVASAAITPTIDPVNMGLVMGPMILLYFLSIGLAYIAQGRRQQRLES
jgi:sec-independent protein translocase protein TatC